MSLSAGQVAAGDMMKITS